MVNLLEVTLALTEEVVDLVISC